MRFKKRSKVEVLNKRDVPLGSWWCAEIVSGNGHTYLVSYDRYLAGMRSGPERVPRKDIRPCPPSLEGEMSWVPGDIVEVFDDHSWKLAEVLRVLGRDYIIVRLIGSAMEFKVHASEIRMRQIWQDNKWVVIQKDSRRCSDGAISKLPRDGRFFCQKTNPVLKDNCAGDDNLPTEFTICTKKMPPLAETCGGARKTRRRIEKEGNCHRLIATKLPNMQEKVDAVTSPQNMLGEQYMHASFNYRNIGFSLTNGGGGMINAVDNCNFRVSYDHSDAESVCSSVGSCSANNSPNRPDVHYLEDLNECSCDDETSSSGRELSLPAKEEESEDGGLPVGAFGGRKDIMQMVAPAGPMYQAGTLSGNPLAMTAGIQTLRRLQERGNYEYLDKITGELVCGIIEEAKKQGHEICGGYIRGMFGLFFTEGPVFNFEEAKKSDTEKFARFHRGMLEEGVYLAPSQFEAGFTSLAHTLGDIETTVAAAKKVFQRI